MSNQYEEFPELTPEAKAAHRAGCLAAHCAATPQTNSDRRYLSAFLREAMKQAGVTLAHRPYGSEIVTLFAIVNNLHSPPPPPPTLAQAQEANLLSPEGRDVVCAFLMSLGGES